MTTFVFRAAVLAGVIAIPASVSAHAFVLPETAPADQWFKAAIVVPHGCDGAPTDTVIVQLPEGFINARPQMMAGWQVEIVSRAYAKPYTLHGETVASGLVEIRWSGNSLPDTQFAEFVVSGQFQGLDAGAQAAFPTTQLCGSQSVVWDQIPEQGQDPHTLEHPAPAITVAEGAANTHAGHGGAAVSGGSATVGDLTLSGGFTRATLPNAPVGGGFLGITNAGQADDRLISATSPAAGDVQLHEMRMDGDVMQMRELADGIAVPAGQTVELAPGGLHLMFMDLRQSFEEGQSIPVTLNFEKAGAVTLDLPVLGAAAKTAGAHANH